MVLRSIAIFFALMLVVPNIARAASAQTLSRWFQSGRCAAFNTAYSANVPFARNDSEELLWLDRFSAHFQGGGNAAYIYDAKHGTVFRSIGGDSTGSHTWRTIGPPPVHVTQSDLSHLSTTSGIRLGHAGGGCH